jgi:hypothetical protein
LRELPILQKLLEQARRRAVTQLVAEKAVIAFIVLFGGAVVLLLAGTQILDWYWIALLAAVSLGVGLYQLRGRIPGLYQVAQRIDRKLKLADTLSTAFHFAVYPDPLRESIAERQARDANESARGVDPALAVPFSRPKYLPVAAGLLVAALALFAVRYLVTGSLSLEPSLVRIALDSFFGGKNQLAKNAPQPKRVRPEPFDPGQPDSAAKGDEKQDDEQANPNEQPDNAPTDAQADSQQQGQDDNQQGKEGQNSDKGQDGGQNKQADQNSKQGQDSKDGKQSDNNQNAKQGGEQKQGGMFDKLRDALANMLKGNKNNDSQQQQGKQNGKQNQQQEQSQDASAQGESQGEQQQSQNSGSQKTGEGKQDQNGADSKGDQKAGEKASQDAKNGIGSADGDKKAREAEMLQAMGKIEELLGKRQQNITGEMIEVQSTKQQLKTPFLQLQGAHGEAGGEIHRDEVPPMYQQFVEQYFEEIRKPPAGAKVPATTAKPTPQQ